LRRHHQCCIAFSEDALHTTEIVVPAQNDLAAGLKQFLSKLCVAVTIFLLLVVLGELGSYIYLRFTLPTVPYADLRVPAGYLRELRESVQHQYLPFVHFRRRPYQGRFISVDEQGVRQTLNSHCNEAGSLKIWMFGDSVLWGTGVVDRETIPSRLARLYNASGRSVCVKNFAEQGWVSTQELVELLLQLKHSDGPPDFVVFYDGTDEVLLPQAGAPKDIDQSYYRFRDLLETSQAEAKPGLLFLRKSNTVRALNLISQDIHRRLSKARPSLSPVEAETIAQALVDNYQKNLQVVDALARTYGFQPFYFWYPTSSAGKKPLTAEERDFVRRDLQGNLARFQLTQALYEICRKVHRPNYFYLGNALDDERGQFYLDDAHLTPEGNEIMAEKIFQVLTKTKTNASP